MNDLVLSAGTPASSSDTTDLTLDERAEKIRYLLQVIRAEANGFPRPGVSDGIITDALAQIERVIAPINGNSILRDWVTRLGLRHQGVLLAAMRGCDTAPRHDPSKLSQRLLRAAVMIPHLGRFSNPKTYITIEPDPEKWREIMKNFLSNWDHYPNHYVVHFIHACEIVGYHGPREYPIFGDRFENFYLNACLALHINPETKEQLDARLNADNETFLKNQEQMRGGLLTKNID